MTKGLQNILDSCIRFFLSQPVVWILHRRCYRGFSYSRNTAAFTISDKLGHERRAGCYSELIISASMQLLAEYRPHSKEHSDQGITPKATQTITARLHHREVVRTKLWRVCETEYFRSPPGLNDTGHDGNALAC